MAATTRARTGNSKPRIVQAIQSALPTTKSTTTTKKTTKANTSQPRAATRVTKPTTTTTTTVKKPRTKTQKLVDAVAGTGEKVKGDVLGKPGVKAAGTKKVRGTDRTTRRSLPRRSAV